MTDRDKQLHFKMIMAVIALRTVLTPAGRKELYLWGWGKPELGLSEGGFAGREGTEELSRKGGNSMFKGTEVGTSKGGNQYIGVVHCGHPMVVCAVGKKGGGLARWPKTRLRGPRLFC